MPGRLSIVGDGEARQNAEGERATPGGSVEIIIIPLGSLVSVSTAGSYTTLPIHTIHTHTPHTLTILDRGLLDWICRSVHTYSSATF